MTPYEYRACELGYSSKAEKKAMREAMREAKLARKAMLEATSRRQAGVPTANQRGRLRRVLSGALVVARFGYLIYAH
jgi:hypothetical protein